MSGKAQYHRDISQRADWREMTGALAGFTAGVGIAVLILALLSRLF